MSELPEIIVKPNGHYLLKGEFRLVDADGNEFEIPEDKQGKPIKLCRCGASQTKPFCDGEHSRIGFEAAEQAVRDER